MNPGSVPVLWKLARIDFDPVRNRPVLLYPEGAVLLNDTGKAILELVDGRRTVGRSPESSATGTTPTSPPTSPSICRNWRRGS